jgi:hypothetical protein
MNTFPSPSRPARVGRLILAGLVLLVAAASLGGAVAGIFGLENNRDASGYFVTHTHRYETSSYALASPSVDVGGVTGAVESGLLRIRITATGSNPAKPLFIGIGRTADVNRYLATVAHDRLRDFRFDPFRVDYRPVAGGAPASLPSTRSFWEAQASGRGTQSVSWPVKGGHWSAVVMNADGSRAVRVNAELGAQLSGAWWFVVGLLVFGAVALLGGIALLRSARRDT